MSSKFHTHEKEISEIWPKGSPRPDSNKKLCSFAEEVIREAGKDPDVRPATLSNLVAAAERLGSGCEDTSNAERFARQHCPYVRFWHGRNKWMLWTGTHWDEDQQANVLELAKETARSIYVEASALPHEEMKKMGRWAERSLNRDKIASMLALAQSDPKLSTMTKIWDQDSWALNFLNGTVDLRTGALRSHDKLDFITKLVDTCYAPDLAGPRWSRFITETFGELADWIQKAVGYSLTGMTTEKLVFLLCGVTDTGKPTFLSTLRELFGDYSVLLQIDTLMHSRGADNNVSADLADLRGARFVITSETEEGQRLREAKLKRITQGMGAIKTTRKYENPITFPETHKLWLDCNHAPMIRGTDDAIWNRIIPIPCTHQVSGAEKDPKLKQKLLLEREAIASWVVAGAVRWHTEVLDRPPIILHTREQWREQMDTLGHFLRECCDVEDSQAIVRASQLYNTFKTWADQQGYQHIFTSTAFGLRLVERGFQKDRDRNGIFYWGIRIC